MAEPISDLGELLRTMRPVFNPGVVAFCVLPPGMDVTVPVIGMFREADGVTVIVKEDDANSSTRCRMEFRASAASAARSWVYNRCGAGTVS